MASGRPNPWAWAVALGVAATLMLGSLANRVPAAASTWQGIHGATVGLYRSEVQPQPSRAWASPPGPVTPLQSERCRELGRSERGPYANCNAVLVEAPLLAAVAVAWLAIGIGGAAAARRRSPMSA